MFSCNFVSMIHKEINCWAIPLFSEVSLCKSIPHNLVLIITGHS